MNGSDCGVFTCKYAEYVSRGAEITFTQVSNTSLFNSLPKCRGKMVIKNTSFEYCDNDC